MTGRPPQDRLQDAARAYAKGDLDGAAAVAQLLMDDPAVGGEACKMLGVVRLRQRRPAEALRMLERAIKANPEEAERHYLAGEAARLIGRKPQAETHYREAVRLAPDMARAYNALGTVIAERSDHLTALGLFEKALALSDTPQPGVLNNMGNVCRFLSRFAEAQKHFEAAIAAKPDLADVQNNLGMLLNDRGLNAEAQAHMDRACALAPGNISFRANRLLIMNYDENVSPGRVAEAHRLFGEELAHASAAVHLPPLVTADEPRVLRIGYLSPDFRSHSVAHFFEPVLEAHDRDSFHITCYANNPFADAVTARLRGLADRWVDITGLSDGDAHKRIRDDKIHILVDLAGLTGHNRVALVARRPAPVIISWIGYPHSVGLTTIDHRFTDAVADPPDAGDWPGPDAPVRLPDGFLCYRPPAEAPEVAVAPVAARGRVSFGSFNNLSKLGPRTVETWAAVARRVPDSRLVLKSRATSDPATAADVRRRFEKHGIAADRIAFLRPEATQKDHLARYAEVDIALDTLGYNGTTTSCEALFMGVPVVAMRGDRHAARVSASLLEHAGFPEWIADSPEHFVEIATALATDRAALARRRTGLRAQVAASPLMDSARTARQVEAAFREAWRGYCRRVAAMTQPDEQGRTPLHLHVGGKQVREGWKILNIQKGPHVDYVGDLADLTAFGDNSVDEVYASHVLEHLDYVKELPAALAGLFRILRPGGRVKLSVPDLETLAGIMADKTIEPDTKYMAMRMMFGGQTDPYDFHKVGLSWTFMQSFLARAGFVDIERVDRLGPFNDSSTTRLADRYISLNVVARKPAAT